MHDQNYGAGLAGNSAGRHAADSHAEQLGAVLVLVENDSDLSTAYGITKQIQLMPLNQK